MNVSIIIVNYNTCKLTLNCIKSILNHTKDITFEIIIVDNASSDNSLITIKKYFPEVFIVPLNKNIGFGRANNLAMNYARGQYILFLNSDTILMNNAIKIFYDFAEKNKHLKIGAIGGILLDSDLNPTHSSEKFYTKRGTLYSIIMGYISKEYWKNKRTKELTNYKKNKKIIEVDYITGADLFIPRSIFSKFKGFDPSFFMYYEETELQLRMKLEGFKRIIIEGPKIIHLEGMSFLKPNFSKEKRLIQTRSMFYYFKKHSSYFGYLIFRFLYFLVKLPILLDTRISQNDRVQYVKYLLTGKS